MVASPSQTDPKVSKSVCAKYRLDGGGLSFYDRLRLPVVLSMRLRHFAWEVEQIGIHHSPVDFQKIQIRPSAEKRRLDSISEMISTGGEALYSECRRNSRLVKTRGPLALGRAALSITMGELRSSTFIVVVCALSLDFSLFPTAF